MTTWDLTHIYKNHDDFENAIKTIVSLRDQLVTFKGKLNDEKTFLEYMKLEKELSYHLGKAYHYASMSSDLNKKDINKAQDYGKMAMLAQSISEALSFESPEIINIGKETIFSFIDNNEELEEYRFGFEKLFRQEEHVLSADKEQLLSYFGSLSNQGSELYSALSVADSNPVTITLSDKTKVNVSQGNWRNLIEKATKQSDRKKIFEAIFSYYDKHKTTYAQIYNTVMFSAEAERKARNHSSILSSFLFNNNIPEEVFLNLISVASTENKAVKKYNKIRKKYLNLSTYHTYDRFIELASSNKEYSYEEGKELFFKSIEHFPADFQEKAHEVLSDGYVDVYEQPGKRSGAYSTGGGSDIHPYILLNYSSSLDDVFTLAHEAGHSIHTLYSMENQKEALRHYTIFVAEIASTFNEHNLLDYLLNSGKLSKNEKIMLLQKSIDGIISTFYRQTLFAEYEYKVSKLVEQGQPLNHDVLSKIMIDLYKNYYGIDIEKEKVKQYVWAYIPHLFYTPFYVYQYATSFSASLKLYEDVKNNVEGAFERYTGLLKSGGSKYPVEQAKLAGVDFLNKETYLSVTRRMEILVDELEKLLSE